MSTSVQYAIATDECPECLSGALDIAQDGDGRWTIDWYPVQCDVADSYFEYSFQGSNAEYVKMAVTNTRFDPCAVPAAISQSATSMPFDTTPVKTSLSRLPVKVKHKTDLHLFACAC